MYKYSKLEQGWSNAFFLKDGDNFNHLGHHKMVTLPESDLWKYEIDEYYCEKIGMDKIFMPYIIKKVEPNQQKLLPAGKVDDVEKVVKFHEFD